MDGVDGVDGLGNLYVPHQEVKQTGLTSCIERVSDM